MKHTQETMLRRFRRRFWLPPRAHGDIIEDRTVSFLELFYDLVYVVVISRAAHTLAEDVSWRGVSEFTAVFGLIWLAWMNGTLYYELHGREDGRTRFFVFVQMLLLALLAVYTAGAAEGTGTAFAIVYAVFLTVVTWLWYAVRQQDSQEYMAITGWYLAGMVTSIVVVAVSAGLPQGARTILWGLLVTMWVLGMVVIARSPTLHFGVVVTDSLVERFGLFVIIVLGEVVVGVVDGLADAERNLASVATGMLGLVIGFAYWWTYFDYAGRRLPVDTPPLRTRWMLAHFPIVLAIAAAGAAMVSLVEHSADSSTPEPTAWLLSGAVVVGVLSLVVVMTTLGEFRRLPELYRPVAGALIGAAGVALLVGWMAPRPWLFALLLVVTLSAVWIFAVDRWLRLDERQNAQG